MAELIGGTYGTAVAHGASNTKGSWVNIGTASADFIGLTIHFIDQDLNNAEQLTEVRINGVTAVADIVNGGRSTVSYEAQSVYIPVGGSSGDDIDVRGQTNSVSSVDVTIAIHLVTDGPCGNASLVGTYGADTATTSGETLDPGGTADTEVKTEITTASGLDGDTNYIALSFFSPSTAQGTELWRVRLYVDATGSTATGIGVVLRSYSTTDNLSDAMHAFSVDSSVFSSGTRVWLGVTCNTNDATDRILEAVMHAYDVPVSGGGGGSVRRSNWSGGFLG